MNNEHICPKCKSVNTYQDMNLWVCLECFHEWDPAEVADSFKEEQTATVIMDAHGNTLNSGDSVMVIKSIKVKGSASEIKAGTKIKNILLVEGHDGHNISCKIDGFGSMYLKSELVKKT